MIVYKSSLELRCNRPVRMSMKGKKWMTRGDDDFLHTVYCSLIRLGNIVYNLTASYVYYSSMFYPIITKIATKNMYIIWVKEYKEKTLFCYQCCTKIH